MNKERNDAMAAITQPKLLKLFGTLVAYGLFIFTLVYIPALLAFHWVMRG